MLLNLVFIVYKESIDVTNVLKALMMLTFE